MRNRLLCMCPSRGRPKLLKEMLESFRKTCSPGTDVAIYIDDDDPTIKEYDLYGDKVWILPRRNVAQAHNFLVEILPGYDYYMAINDDMKFITPGWDKILMETIESKGAGWGIAYPDDSSGNKQYSLPTFGCMSANIVKILGNFYPKELKMMNGDIFLLDLGRAIGKLFYCPTAIVKHSPPGISQQAFVPGDHRAAVDFKDSEFKAYEQYVHNRMFNDVEKILEAITNEQAVTA